MDRSLDARAPAAAGRAPTPPKRRRVARLGLVAIGLVAGLATPIHAEFGRTPRADPELGLVSDGHVASSPNATDAPDRRRAGHLILAAEPLAPAPPVDQRDAPDPFVLADDDRYVLYSTQVGFNNVPVATSRDLRDWSAPGDALPVLPAWAAWGRTWAPGVTRIGDSYVLYFTALHQGYGRQCIGAATSAAAHGPFTPTAAEPLVCQTHLGGSIDPYPFRHPDGTPYLLWKADGNAIGQPSTLFAQGLTPDGLALVGEPAALITSGAEWERPLIENPAMVVADQTFVLLYSGGWWESDGYAVGYATCDTPLGPCTKATVTEPLLATAGDEAGPGGACVVTGPAGDHWLAYHAWTAGAVGYEPSGGVRSLRFASLTWSGTQPVVAR
jgi:beta-xylosidase